MKETIRVVRQFSGPGLFIPEFAILCYESGKVDAEELMAFTWLFTTCACDGPCADTDKEIAVWWQKSTKEVARILTKLSRAKMINIEYASREGTRSITINR